MKDVCEKPRKKPFLKYEGLKFGISNPDILRVKLNCPDLLYMKYYFLYSG